MSQQPDLVHLPLGITLLARCVCKDHESLDLTPYTNITPDEVCRLLELVVAQAPARKTFELTLPDMETLQMPELKKLVETNKVASLHARKTPLIKLDSIMKLVAASSIDHLTHPQLYTRCFDLTISTQFARPKPSWSEGFPHGTGLNFPLMQIVYVPGMASNSSLMRVRGGELKWSQAPVGQRHPDPFAVVIPMEDVLMSADRFLQFIPMALERLASADVDRLNGTFSASSVLTGLAKRGSIDEDNKITCVPGMMLATWMKAGTSFCRESTQSSVP